MQRLAELLGTPLKRLAVLLLLDVALFMATMTLAFYARLEELPWERMGPILGFMLILRIPALLLTRSYSMSFQFTSLRDMVRVLGVISATSATAAVAIAWAREFDWSLTRAPYGVIPIEWAFACLGIAATRLRYRMARLLTQGRKPGKRALIIGAGGASEQLLRSMLSTEGFNCTPVGLLDDDTGKLNTTLHGVRVVGACNEISATVERLKVETVIVAIPSAPTARVREWFDASRLAGVTDIRILPHISEILDGQVSVRDIRKVSLHDLLGREAVQIDLEAVRQIISGKTVLITGAAGSIGSEIARQVAKLSPNFVVILDREETGLFHIEQELKRDYPKLQVAPVIADVAHAERVRSVFADHKPFLVFHAAAYKHVPMMEENPEEAVRNNVLGTLITARAAEEAGVSRFVFISTDKAVDPISVMGKTKRAGELIVRALSGTGKTRFMSVRFGNVMGSRGSVIESFQKQIEAGGPVTVTHVQMERFFMLTSEAVLLVLQAAALGSGGETFILDMGKPIRIMDLASEMIRLAGLEPERDIKIKITGVRPGERLSERLHFEDEILGPTPHPKVFVAKQSGALLGQSILSALDAYTEGRIESAPTVFLDQIITSGGVPSSHT